MNQETLVEILQKGVNYYPDPTDAKNRYFYNDDNINKLIGLFLNLCRETAHEQRLLPHIAQILINSTISDKLEAKDYDLSLMKDLVTTEYPIIAVQCNKSAQSMLNSIKVL
jgi:hypothetical protein